MRLLAPLITAENHRDLLARAAGLSKRQVEALVASLAPKPDVVSHIRRLPAVNPAEMNQAETLQDRVRLPVGPPLHSAPPGPTADVEHASSGTAVPAVATPVPQPAVGHTSVAPLSATRYRLQCTISEAAHADLRLAQDLLRRQIPDGDFGAIIERALALLVARIAKEKTAVVSMAREETAATSEAKEQMAATSAPEPARSATPGSRHIPAAVRRAVWLRDRGQCAFVARQGRRCAERAFLELHHIRPFALGGEATVSNISLRCRRHNAYEAQMEFSPCTLRKTGRAIAPAGVGQLEVDPASGVLKSEQLCATASAAAISASPRG